MKKSSKIDERPLQIGVFGDIHGNYPVLLSLWREMERLDLTSGTLLNAGDSVCYGDQPEETIRFLASRTNILSVLGNYDRAVALFPQRFEEYNKKWGISRPEKLNAIRRDSELISTEAREWLLTLPKERTVRIGKSEIVLTHYSPGSKVGIGPWTEDSVLERLASQTSASIVVCGHTHFPFVRTSGNVLFVNPGTLGRSMFNTPTFAVLAIPTDGPPSASILTLDTS